MNNNTKRKDRPIKYRENPISYYYWDENFKNKDDLSLQECYDRFGTKIVMANKFYYKVVFLDETKDLGYSWMLWSKDIATDKNMRFLYMKKIHQ